MGKTKQAESFQIKKNRQSIDDTLKAGD